MTVGGKTEAKLKARQTCLSELTTPLLGGRNTPHTRMFPSYCLFGGHLSHLLLSSTMRMAIMRRCSMVRKLPYKREELNSTLPGEHDQEVEHDTIKQWEGQPFSQEKDE